MVESKDNLPYGLGMPCNGELSPDYVRTHRETDQFPGVIPLHSHMFFEIAYVRDCSDAEYVIGADIYHIRSGDILLIPPEVLHGAVVPERAGEVCVRDVLWVSPQFLNRLAQMRPSGGIYENRDAHLFRTAGTSWDDLGQLFADGIAEQQRRQFGWESIVVGNTMVLLSRLTRAMLDESVLILQHRRTHLLPRVLDYMETHLAEKLTLQRMAAQFDVSKSTLTQMFRKKLDVSFYTYLTKRRLTVAKGFIARGMPIEQAGKQVGFTEHSAFYRAFKQLYGISPREYRIGCMERENEMYRDNHYAASENSNFAGK